ncbi:MAG: helix-turn-helix domain-containing protein, partial [Myxococcota bacterium]
MVSRRKATSAEVAADRRKQILKAAVEVFADRGFHRTRVSDIAKRAGVAYGLIYHYFDSKDHVLNCVFEENWAVFIKV